MTFSYGKFEITGLLPWQIQVLFNTNKISMNKENFAFIKQNYPKNLFDYIFADQTNTFNSLLDSKTIKLENTEILELLNDYRTTDEFASKLINLYVGPITVVNKKYNDSICANIIRNRFSVDDLSWLFINYNILGTKTQNALIEYSRENVSQIINTAKTSKLLPPQIFASFIASQKTEPATILQLRKVLNDNRYDLVCTSSKSPSFVDTKYNRTILEYFVLQEWISSYAVANNKLRAYPKRKVS